MEEGEGVDGSRGDGLHGVSVLVMTLSWRINSRDEVLLLGKIKRAQALTRFAQTSPPDGGYS